MKFLTHPNQTMRPDSSFTRGNRWGFRWALVAIAVAAFLSAKPVRADGHGYGPEYLGTYPDWPLSDAVRLGDTLYLSGKLGTVPGTATLVDGGIQAETRQILENIKVSLKRHGSSMDRVVKCTVFLADISEWGAMNEIYGTYFPVNKPARTAVGVSGLPLNGRVEIECIAMVGS